MKTAVVVDSGSNYYNEKLNIPGIFAIPLQIIDQDKAYLESVEISIAEVNQKMEAGLQIQTSLPVLGQIEELFKEIKKQGYQQILAIPITSGLSGTIQAMATAANQVQIKFDFIDCYTTMYVQLYCALKAREYLDSGLDIEKVKNKIEPVILNSNTFIVPDDLKHLSAGGRLSPLAARLGGLLRIKPILHLDKNTKGIIDPFDKVRTMSRALKRVVEAFQEEGVDETYEIMLCDVNNSQAADTMEKELKKIFPKTKIHRRPLISTVAAHVGIGTIALQYLKTI